MTTIIPFEPTASAPFQFQATLDGQIYTCAVTWNLFGQRWYLGCYTLTGTLMFNRALVGSPLGYDINLAAGIFTTSALVYRAPTGQFEISP